MNPIVCLLDCPELSCFPVMRILFGELGEAFISYGFKYTVIDNLDNLPDFCIVLLCNTKLDMEVMKKIYQKSSGSIFIGWYFHDIYEDIIKMRMKFILTGEYLQEKPLDNPKSHLRYWNIEQKAIFVPFKLMANEDSRNVGSYDREDKFYCGYVGSPYKQDWLRNITNTYIYIPSNESKFMPFSDRRNLYLTSIIAPGFQSEENILNHHVSQRVYEGLCYGCVVISEHPDAHKMTNGIVEYASTKDEFHNRVNYFLSHPEECKKKRIAGYEWIKNHGTNRLVALDFLNKIKEIYDIDY